MSMSSRGPSTDVKEDDVEATTEKLHETTLEGSDDKPVVAATSAVEEVTPEAKEKEEVTADATPAAEEATPDTTAPVATIDDTEKAPEVDASQPTNTLEAPAAASSASSSYSLFSSRVPSPVPVVEAAPDSPRP